MFTTTFYKTLEAYNSKRYRYIINKGSSRSGKTYGELQLIDQKLQRSKTPKIVTSVSHSLPHLEGGAIRDYDSILMNRDVMPESIRTKRPYIYTYQNRSIHEFVGFDSPGKALGAARDILFINEGNKMPFDVVHQLIQRTRETVFVDYNPSNRFWIEEIENRADAITIHSTYKDNIQNLTAGQIEEFAIGKQKADEEAARGVYGYWSNWWSVYGLGEYGQVEGAIYTDWSMGQFDTMLPFRFGLDFGFSNDPDALVKIAVDEKRKLIYMQECMYKTGQSFDILSKVLSSYCGRNDLIVADSAEPRLISDLNRLFNIQPSKKWAVNERIKKMQSYHLVVTPESKNLINEITEYVWSDKKSETPIDKNNHLLDAAGYALTGMAQRTTTKGYF